MFFRVVAPLVQQIQRFALLTMGMVMGFGRGVGFLEGFGVGCMGALVGLI